MNSLEAWEARKVIGWELAGLYWEGGDWLRGVYWEARWLAEVSTGREGDWPRRLLGGRWLAERCLLGGRWLAEVSTGKKMIGWEVAGVWRTLTEITQSATGFFSAFSAVSFSLVRSMALTCSILKTFSSSMYITCIWTHTKNAYTLVINRHIGQHFNFFILFPDMIYRQFNKCSLFKLRLVTFVISVKKIGIGVYTFVFCVYINRNTSDS